MNGTAPPITSSQAPPSVYGPPLSNRLKDAGDLWYLVPYSARGGLLAQAGGATKGNQNKFKNQLLGYILDSDKYHYDPADSGFAGLKLPEKLITQLDRPTTQQLVKNVLAYRFGIAWNGEKLKPDEAGKETTANAFIDTQTIIAQAQGKDLNPITIAKCFINTSAYTPDANLSTQPKLNLGNILYKPISEILGVDSSNPNPVEKLILERLGFQFTDKGTTAREEFNPRAVVTNAHLPGSAVASSNTNHSQQVNSKDLTQITQGNVEDLYKSLPEEAKQQLTKDGFAQALFGEKGFSPGSIGLGMSKERFNQIYKSLGFREGLLGGLFGIQEVQTSYRDQRVYPNNYQMVAGKATALITRHLPLTAVPNGAILELDNRDQAQYLIGLWQFIDPKQWHRKSIATLLLGKEPVGDTVNLRDVKNCYTPPEYFNTNSLEAHLLKELGYTVTETTMLDKTA